MSIRPVPTQGILFFLLSLLLIGCGDFTDGYSGSSVDDSSSRPTVIAGSDQHPLPHGKPTGFFNSHHPTVTEREEEGDDTPAFTFHTTIPVKSIQPVAGPKPQTPVTSPLPACHDVTGVHQGNLYIYDLDELENASAYAEIHGDLIIPGSVVTDTIELPCLRVITGALFKPGCNSTPLLTKMSFPRLESAGSIEIWATQALDELHLPALVSVGKFRVEYNFLLTTLTLTSLEEITGSLTIIDGALETLSIPKLKSISGSFTVQDNFQLSNLMLPLLEETGGSLSLIAGMFESLFMPNLKSVGNSFTVSGNPHLHTLSIPDLANASGLYLKELPELAALTFPSIETLGTLEVSNLHALKSFSIPTLHELDWLKVLHNSTLESFHLPEIDALEGGLQIHFNNLLPTVQMPQLTTVGKLSVQSNESLEVVHMANLTSADDVEVLSKGGAWMPVKWISFPVLETLHWNLKITDLLALEGVYIPQIEAIDNFTLVDTATLTDFHLPALKHVTGNMNVRDNQSLVSLRLPSLESVGKSLWIHGGWWTLEEVEMPLLEEVGSYFTFENNHLIDTNPFESLTFVYQSFVMANNFSLPQCSVDALLETLLASDAHDLFTPDTDGNLEGCLCDGWGHVIEGTCT